MKHARRYAHLGLVAAMAITLWACGKSATQANAPTAMPAATATTIAQAEQNALPLQTAMAIPKDLKCSDAIVWVNLRRHNYHEPADPYYGRTRNGRYMCLADAKAAGYHAAGERRVRNMHAATSYPEATPTPY